jgi:uroporphyrin-III C-methyltransferase/precorrin-2 dehydrogenase/sirohydrochlorin ferrochelatase
MKSYPVFLRLEGRRALIVGGGKAAAAKLPALIEAGARVAVVAPAISPELAHPGVELRRRPFSPDDLEGVFFVVSAAPPEVNRAVAAAAEARGLFVNAVDDAEAASAWLSGVLRRGDVTLAISTAGRSPALAGLLREALDRLLPEDLQAWVELGETLRRRWKADGVPMRDRRPLLLRVLQEIYP